MLLSHVVLVEETLEAVENGTAEDERLFLVHHGHEKNDNGRSVFMSRKNSIYQFSPEDDQSIGY